MNPRICHDEREAAFPADDWTQAWFVLAMVLIAVAATVITMADWPPASWINNLQGALTGFYSRKLTGVVLAGIAMQPVIIVRSLALSARRKSED